MEGHGSKFHLIIIQKYMRQDKLSFAIVTTNPEFQWFNKVYFSLMLPPNVSRVGTSGQQGHSRTSTGRGVILTHASMVIQAGKRGRGKFCTDP